MPLLPYAVMMLVATALAQDWNYDQCDSTKGPFNWPGACKNQNNAGTPIDLCAARGFPGTIPTFSVANYAVDHEVTVSNDGKAIQIQVNDPQMTLKTTGGLGKLVGRGTGEGVQDWVFAQMHMHWGRTGRTDEGSEHYMQGKRYPLEAHFVHYSAAYTSLTAAVTSGAPDSLLVVGVFFEQSNTNLKLMKAIGDSMWNANTKSNPNGLLGSWKLSEKFALDEFFSTSGAFYSYGGSLTTPGCLEQVTWLVMRDVKPITLETLNDIKLAGKTSTEPIAKYGNYRPIQPLGTRMLYSSTGSTAQCDSVRSDPVFQCSALPTPPTTTQDVVIPASNAGSLASPSILGLLVALCATYLQATL